MPSELLREAGVDRSRTDGLYDSKHLAVVHHLNAALRANAIYHRDVDYIVRDGEVMIVDEFTGRTLARAAAGRMVCTRPSKRRKACRSSARTRRWPSMTFQNLFRMYKKLAGMTGTADTEAYEFQQIYGLEVVVIPTHKPMIRKDNADMVFLGQEVKYEAVIEDIKDCVRARPARAGGHDLDRRCPSCCLDLLQQQAKIPHEVLNAKQHEREAHIVAQAGAPGSVTIATNMAGRGTDIVLGGSLEAALSSRCPRMPAEAQRDAGQDRLEEAPRAGARLPVVCTSSAPSATSRVVSTTSCAVVRVARAIRVRAVSICRCEDNLHAHLRGRLGRRAGCACSA